MTGVYFSDRALTVLGELHEDVQREVRSSRSPQLLIAGTATTESRFGTRSARAPRVEPIVLW